MDAKGLIAKGYNLLTKTSNSQYAGFDGIFTVDARIEEKISRKSTVTKFYVEDGTSASDHIIVEPLLLTVSGEVSNVYYQPNLLLQEYSKLRESLGNIAVYLPNRTNSMISKIDKIVNKTTNTLRKVSDISDKIQQLGTFGENELGIKNLKEYTDVDLLVGKEKRKNLETTFIKFVEDYSLNRKLMQVETQKYGTLENMAIVNYTIVYRDENAISYTLDLQEIREVKTLVTPIKQIAKKTSGTQSGTQTQDKQDKGIVQGKKKSFLVKVFQ